MRGALAYLPTVALAAIITGCAAVEQAAEQAQKQAEQAQKQLEQLSEDTTTEAEGSQNGSAEPTGTASSPSISRASLSRGGGFRQFVYPEFKGQPIIAPQTLFTGEGGPFVGQDPACVYESSYGCEVTPEQAGLKAIMSLWATSVLPPDEVHLSNAALFFAEQRFDEWGLVADQDETMTAGDPWPNQRYNLGEDSFEEEETRQRFVNEVVPELKAWAEELPERVWLVARLSLGEYDFERGAFPLTARYPKHALNVRNGGYDDGIYNMAAPSSLDNWFVNRWLEVPEDRAQKLYRSLEEGSTSTRRHIYLVLDVTVRPHAFVGSFRYTDAESEYQLPRDEYGNVLDPIVVHRHILFNDEELTEKTKPNWEATITPD